MDNSRTNLLEEAIGINKGGRIVVVEDCVETSGAFVLHHFLKRSLHPDSSDVVVFIAFADPFSHYDRILRKMGCSFVTLNHEDIYSTANTLPLILQPEYLADVIIKAEPLATGLASDVHGQLTVLNKGGVYDLGGSSSKVCNFHFRVKENNVDYFYPGTQT